MNTRTIEVVEHQSQWQQQFAQERDSLKRILGNNAVNIHHIGSTSVPGLAAKPIIDILIEVTSLKQLDAANIKLQDIGYIAKGENGIVGRRYFQKGQHIRTHHVHAFESRDPHLVRHLAFKRYLEAHLDVKNEYSDVKKRAAKMCDNEPQLYMNLKNDFITEHEKRAVSWFSQK